MAIFNSLRAERITPPTCAPKIIHYRDLVEAQSKPPERVKAKLKPCYLGACKPLPAGEKLPEYYKQILSAPHTLIAGSTGCGKSTFLHNVLYELMGTYTPREASYVLIDPKRVELVGYKKTKFCIGYADNNLSALDLLEDTLDLIEDRYKTMQELGDKQWRGNRTFVIIDELADLLVDYEVGGKVKRTLQKILQISRAAGVCVIACTQCPARKILPAELTLNFTERIGLRCLSATESRQIIGAKGCEAINCYGKAYYQSSFNLSAVNVPLTSQETLDKRGGYWV